MVMKQKALVILIVVFASGVCVFEIIQGSRLQVGLRMMEIQNASMAKQIGHLQLERDQASNHIVFLTHEVDRLTTNSAELPKLRAEVATLRSEARDLSHQLENGALSDPALTAVRLNNANQPHRESFGFEPKR